MEGSKTDGYIVEAACVVHKRCGPNGRVLLAQAIGSERISSNGSVETCNSVCSQRIGTDSNVVDAGSVGHQSKRSIGRVGFPSRIAQKSSGAYSRVLLGSGVQSECRCTKRCVEVPSGVVQQRKKANTSIKLAATKRQQRGLPFCRVASGISAIWWRNYRVRWLQKREAGEQRNKNQRECIRFHMRIVPLCSLHGNAKMIKDGDP